mgnify:CR=1 FL=1
MLVFDKKIVFEFVIPIIIKIRRNVNNIGVKIFPTISTTLVDFIDSIIATEKYSAENINILLLGKAISKAVAADLGAEIRIKQTSITISKILAFLLPITPKILFESESFFKYADIPIKTSPTSANINNKKDKNQYLPDIAPIYVGNIKFPAPKSIENNAKPTVKQSKALFFINHSSITIIPLNFMFKKI